MRIGLLSDTHNNEPGTIAALDILRREGIDTVLHCGDMTRYSVAELFKDFCIHHVEGNNDLDMFSIGIAIQECKAGSSSSKVYSTEIDGRRIVMMHGDNMRLFYRALDSGEYDYLLHGHTHIPEDFTRGETRILCPGALGGRRPARRGFFIVDFATGDIEDISVE